MFVVLPSVLAINLYNSDLIIAVTPTGSLRAEAQSGPGETLYLTTALLEIRWSDLSYMEMFSIKNYKDFFHNCI